MIIREGRQTGDRKIAALRRTDLAVLSHLDASREQAGGDICTASIPSIHRACGVSPRQVQISVGRLTKAKLIRRVGYDFGNPDRNARGTIYKLLIKPGRAKGIEVRTGKSKILKSLLHVVKSVISALDPAQRRDLAVWLAGGAVTEGKNGKGQALAVPRRGRAGRPAPRMSYRLEGVRCGKANCKCATGDLHGPYWYAYWTEKGRLRSKYVGRKRPN
jgi:hypothetical protein